MDNETSRHYWTAASVTVGCLVLTVAGLLTLPGTMPTLAPIAADSGPLLDFVTPERVAQWFDPVELARLANTTDADNPFFTHHFDPPPPPPPPPPDPPPPPPPTTRMAPMLFQGTVRTSEERLLAYLRIEERLLILTNGAPVLADVGIARISPQQVVLTNSAGRTNILLFRVPAEVEVPITP